MFKGDLCTGDSEEYPYRMKNLTGIMPSKETVQKAFDMYLSEVWRPKGGIAYAKKLRKFSGMKPNKELLKKHNLDDL